MMQYQRLQNDTIPELKLNSLQLKTKAQIEQKINDKIYQFENNCCPVCESENAELIGEKDRYGLYYSTQICSQCGLVYTNPRMTQPSYNEFYNTESRKLYLGTAQPSEAYFYRQRERGKKIHQFLNSDQLLAAGSLLVVEIGCSSGGILDFFKGQGHQIKGIDLGEQYVNYGRDQHHLDLKTGTIDDLTLDRKADVIIYSHVLEHVLDLAHELKKIKQIAHENTIIYIEVPGIKNIHRNYEMNILKYFQNAHTYNFSLTSLSNLMNKHGFKLLKGTEYVKSVFKVDNDKKTILTDYESVIAYINHQEKYRFIYPITYTGLKKRTLQLILNIFTILGIRKFLRKIRHKMIH